MGNALCCSWSPCQKQNDSSRDIMRALEGLRDMSMDDAEQLITYIDEILSNIDRGGQVPIRKPTSVDSFIDSGRDLTKTLSKRLKRHIGKKCLLSALNRKTGKLVLDVASPAQNIPYVGMTFGIIGHLLERSEQFSSNNEHIIELLRSMCDLIKYTKNLGIHVDQAQLDGIFRLIVKGTPMCAVQMEPNIVCRFCFAPLDAADLESIKSQIDRCYQKLPLDAVTDLSNTVTSLSNTVTDLAYTQPSVPGPSQGQYPHNAVGIHEAENRVTQLLDLKDLSRRVVVIYGVGGIGKTTLATAVFKSLDLTGYNYCRVDMDQDARNSDLPPLQKQILRDVFKKNLELNDSSQGQEKLLEAFKEASKPVFLFIDNALKGSNLERLLPMEHLSRLPLQSRILVTTRNVNETNIFRLQAGVKVDSHKVDSVSDPEAKKLLCHYALGVENGSFQPAVNINGLVQICGGIPLVLKIVGSQLRLRGNTVSACNELLEHMKEWQRKGFEGGGEDLSECIVDFVYRRLKESSQEAFLDIVFFFQNNWERSRVGDIVGLIELEDLEGAALVTTSPEDVDNFMGVKVHDIVSARGRRLSEGNRITDTESLSLLLTDEQKLKQTKGVCLLKCRNILEAKHVDLMSKSLRVLNLGYTQRVNGRREKDFEDLRFLSIYYEDMLPIDVTKSKRLVYFNCNPEKPMERTGIQQLPESLRLLHFNNGEQSQPLDSPVSLEHLTSLRELSLHNITLANLETFFSQLKSLRLLQLNNCKGFTSIPETLGNISCLKILRLSSNLELVTLPASFGNLTSLRLLDISGCSMLDRLPESFGNLSSMQYLNISECSTLEGLPERFGNLSSMQKLYMSNCSMLKKLPVSFGNLSSMQKLYMSNCSMLKKLPESFGNLSSMQDLNMSNCSILEKLPESFGDLSSMKDLNMSKCSMLEGLHESFGNLSSMQNLNMSECSMLKKLPQSFGNLSSMQVLNTSKCSMLERLPQTFDQLSCLQRLKMDGCEKMCNLFDNFGQLKCLKFLDISYCKQLQSLPNDILCLTSLAGMKAYGCAELEAKAMDSLVEIKSLMFLEMGESPMLIKRWEQIQQHRPLIGAALRFENGKYPYEEIMSTMFFSSGSRFLHVDGEGQLAEASFPDSRRSLERSKTQTGGGCLL